MVVNVATHMKTCDLMCLAAKEIGFCAKAAWAFSGGRTGLTGANDVYCSVICLCHLTFWTTAR